jgi:hypothetical protein
MTASYGRARAPVKLGGALDLPLGEGIGTFA